MIVKRGDIFMAEMGKGDGSTQGGLRPVLVISNDLGNRFSSCVLIAPITSQTHKAKLPTHVALKADEHGLVRDSVVLCEKITDLSKNRLLGDCLTHLDLVAMAQVNQAINISTGTVEIKRERTNRVHREPVMA